MDPKVIFCYLYYFAEIAPLSDALGEEVDRYGQSNYWIGVEIVHGAYKLSVADTNAFFNKYLINGKDDK